MRWGRTLVPLSLITGAILVLPACSVVENWMGGSSGVDGANETVEEITEEPGDIPEPEAPNPEASGFEVPTCETLYSSELTNTLLGEVRVNFGDTSEGDFGYGTTNVDLVKILQDVRSDLKVSCTWVLQASESASVTSVAILSEEVESDVLRILRTAGGTGEESSGGLIWTVESPLSEVSPDIDATEVHYLEDITCPASVADSQCVVWVTTNYSFGNARVLTLDAARTLGAFSN
jgi:hypothetical protein